MELRLLGDAGLTLSALSLGTLTWGRDTDADEAGAIMRAYVEAGGTSLDVLSDWHCPIFAGRLETVGSLLSGPYANENLTLTMHSGTLPQAYSPTPIPPLPGPATSRKYLLESLEYSLRALGRSAVDLWVIHGPRQRVSLPEIMSAAQSAYDTGKATYVALAGFSDWDLGAASTRSYAEPPQISGMVTPLSLLDASSLKTTVPQAAAAGLGVVAHSPLAQGVLTGKYQHSTPPDSRAATAHLGPWTKEYFGNASARVVEATVRTSEELGKHPAQIALAWVLGQPGVTSAVTGPRTLRQLESLLEGFPVHLPREIREVLTEIALY